MITQHSIFFLKLLLSWSKCLTLPYTILRFFLQSLKKSVMNLEKAEAFSVATRGPMKSLSFPLSSVPSPFSLAFRLLCLCVYSPWSLINSSSTSALYHTALCWLEESSWWEGRKSRLPALCFPAHLSGATLGLLCPRGSLHRSSLRAVLTEPSWSLQPSETFSSPALTRL